ncbi:hypothetical protein BaRGS_00035274 [Batillaria attramentaria]|uniref:Uncharacterized protein n=1 Tax=Batillaria attramentaria TaxID=370345 RepID=A0ABD0JF48_9CAEN
MRASTGVGRSLIPLPSLPAYMQNLVLINEHGISLVGISPQTFLPKLTHARRETAQHCQNKVTNRMIRNIHDLVVETIRKTWTVLRERLQASAHENDTPVMFTCTQHLCAGWLNT